MDYGNRKILQISFALLWIIFSFHCQFAISSSTQENPLGIFSESDRVKKLTGLVASFLNGSLLHGLLDRRPCFLRPDLLNPLAIKATRESIQQCTEAGYNCDSAQKSKFRTIDGSCNNIKHPTWGRSDNCLQRVLPFDYADGKSEPRVSHSGKPLPNPRNVSNVFHREIENHPNPESTTMRMEWGQLVSHDLSLNDVFRLPESENNIPIDCCANGPVTNEMCMSAATPSDDPVHNISCQLFARTVPCSACTSTQRISSNKNTAFQDLSLVYGSTEERAKELRSGDRGMLRVESNRKSGPMPPTVLKESECFSPTSKPACYHAGDPRINMIPQILTLQIIFLRFHNYICKKLSKINPHWDDERVYQEARRINIAIVQFHTYKNYLPLIIGKLLMKLEGIEVLPGASYTEYDPEVDPTITDEFAAAAARYGHTMIPGNLSIVNPKTGKTKTAQLRDYYFTPFKFADGMFDKVAKGMTLDNHLKHDRLLSMFVSFILFIYLLIKI